MVVLHMRASTFGQKTESVRAFYETKEEAIAQAEANLARNTQTPLYIEDLAGEVLTDYRKP